eukprot:TRINITY_DN11839_c0_g1_i3.p3 TRINITY_DN11839_c0_g1~~TRINITY_DN11839_c0_g1_i3.p3  ORF type:complete len:164 (+),score=74.54 TRINITY_DN11839_c0_g1_i3:52-492(+)
MAEKKPTIEEYKTAFAMFDKNGDGHITAKELGDMLSSIGGARPTDTELQDMIREVDTDGSGTVELNEFVAMMERKIAEDKDEAKEAFKMFDLDGNGLITAVELKQVMAKLGEALSDAEITAMIKEADADGDGQINFNEFKKIMLST